MLEHLTIRSSRLWNGCRRGTTATQYPEARKLTAPTIRN